MSASSWLWRQFVAWARHMKKVIIGTVAWPFVVIGVLGAIVYVPLAAGFEMGMDAMMWLFDTKRGRR